MPFIFAVGNAWFVFSFMVGCVVWLVVWILAPLAFAVYGLTLAYKAITKALSKKDTTDVSSK